MRTDYNVTVSLGGGTYSGVGTATADDTTPSVSGVSSLLLVANTGATAITQLDDGIAGQIVVLQGTSNTNSATIADGAPFYLTGAWTATSGHTLTLVAQSVGVWVEISRTDTT